MKDPQDIGKKMFRLRKKLPKVLFSHIADMVVEEKSLIRDYPKDFQHDYSEQYKKHLKETNSPQAKEMLEALEKGEKLSDDPSGE